MCRTTPRSWLEKQHRQLQLPLEFCKSLRICVRIDTSSAETGSSATSTLGRKRQRARNRDALALAAAELVRIAVDVECAGERPTRSSSRSASRSHIGFVTAMQHERPLQRLRHRQARIERGVGILKHDLDIAAKRLEVRPPQFRQRACRASGSRPTIARADFSIERPERALAAPALAHQRNGLVLVQGQVDAVDRMHAGACAREQARHERESERPPARPRSAPRHAGAFSDACSQHVAA